MKLKPFLPLIAGVILGIALSASVVAVRAGDGATDTSADTLKKIVEQNDKILASQDAIKADLAAIKTDIEFIKARSNQ
jgi:hypothetical protein